MPTTITHDMIPETYRYAVRTQIGNLSSGNKHALRNVLLVGARQGDDDQLADVDTFYLNHFLRLCTEFRWPLHPNFAILRTNIYDDPQDDFLRLRTPFDAVIFCYLFHQHGEEPVSDRSEAFFVGMNHGVQADTYLQSPDHCQGHLWHRRLKRSGVKVIGNVKSMVNDLDLPNSWLHRRPYGCLGGRPIAGVESRRMNLFANRRWKPAGPQFEALRAA